MNIATLTGLEIMQAFAAGNLPRPPISDTMPMTPDQVEEGRVVFLATAWSDPWCRNSRPPPVRYGWHSR